MEQNIKRYFSRDLGFGKDKPQAIELLRQTVAMLNECGITYFLISGTLLGPVRHGDFIPWDDDMDLIVDSSILEKFDAMMTQYPSNTFTNKGNYLLKIFPKDKTWPFVDLFPFSYSEDKTQITFFNKTWDAKQFFPAHNTTFLGIDVCIPASPKYFLDRNFGPNHMIEMKSSTWNHKTETGIRGTCTIPTDLYFSLQKKGTF